MAQLKVEVIVGLVNRLTGGLRGVQRDLRRFGRDMTVIGAGMGSVGRQLLDPIRDAVELSNQLSGELTEVAIVAGQSADAVAALRPALRAMARDSIQPMQELAESMGAMTAKGLGWDQARAALPEIARTATAARARLGDLEAVAAAVISQLGIDPAQIADPFNRLAAAANAGGFELRDMAEFLPQVTAAMAKLDTGTRAVTNLGAALQVIRKGAGGPAQTATQLTDLLEKMTSPAVVGALEKKFGVDLPAAMQTWKTKGLDPLAEFVGLMQRVTGGDAFRIAQIFGDKEARAGLTSLMRNWAEFEAIRARAAAAPGQDLIGQMFATRTRDDPILRLLQLSIDVQTLVDQLGTSLAPVLSELVAKVTPWVARLGDWIERNRELAGTIALWAAGAAAFLAVAGPLVMGIAAIAGALALISSPILLGIAAIGALGAALVWVGTHWDKFKAWVANAALAVRDAFGDLPEWLKNIGKSMMEGLLNGMLFGLPNLVNGAVSIAKKVVGVFQRETDTHSPSRVFAALGSDLMRGLGVGIDAAARIPMARVRAAAAGVVTTAALTGPAMASAAPAGISIPISITINAPAGTDARELAALVRRQVDEASRAAAGRIAALYDTGDGL